MAIRRPLLVPDARWHVEDVSFLQKDIGEAGLGRRRHWPAEVNELLSRLGQYQSGRQDVDRRPLHRGLGRHLPVFLSRHLAKEHVLIVEVHDATRMWRSEIGRSPDLAIEPGVFQDVFDECAQRRVTRLDRAETERWARVVKGA